MIFFIFKGTHFLSFFTPKKTILYKTIISSEIVAQCFLVYREKNVESMVARGQGRNAVDKARL